MARPITLFTGQWADLTLDDLAGRAASFGFDGLELACWGDHFEVDRALAEPELRGRAARDARAPRPGVLVDRQPPRRPGRLRPDRRAPPGRPAARGVGRRRSRGRAHARRRADEGHRARRGGPRRAGRHRLHRLGDLAPALLLPAQRLGAGAARLRGLRRALGADHRRLRRRGRALRAGGPSDGDRLRLRDHAQGAGRHRPPRGLRHQPRPEPLHPAVPRSGGLRERVRRPHLPRARQGLAGHARRPALDPRLAHRLRRGRARLDVRLARPRRRRLRGAVPRPQSHRLRRPAVGRMGGLGHGSRMGSGRRASASCARPTSRPRRSPSTRPSRGRNERLPHAGRRTRRGRRRRHRGRDARLRLHGQGPRQRLPDAVLHDLAAAADARAGGDRRAQRGGGGRGGAPLRLRRPRDRLARRWSPTSASDCSTTPAPTTSTPSRRSPPPRPAST